MIRISIIFLLFCLTLTSFAQTYTVESVPNQKLIDNSYVSNPDSILNTDAVNRINHKLKDLEDKTTVQVAVVVLKSIGTADIFDFAQELFDHWGIGHANKSNGLLVLLVFDQRTVRFHTGHGLEGVLPDIICKHIQMQEMIPYFKMEDYNKGMIAGIDEVAFVLSNPAYAEELRDDSQRESSGWNTFFYIALTGGGALVLIWFLILLAGRKFADSPPKDKIKVMYPEMRLTHIEWLILFAVFPLGILITYHFITIDVDNYILTFILILYGYFACTLILKRIRIQKVEQRLLKDNDYHGATGFFQDYQTFWLVMGIFFPLPFLPLFFQYLARKKYFRNHPRNCSSCSSPLHKLDEKTDDQYLKKSQVFEEELRSVDYDVWLCDKCQHTEILNYVNRFSKYDSCPACKTKAFFKESDRTISRATYTSTGTGQITKRCRFCNHQDVSTYTIAMLTPPSSSSDSSSSGSGSSGGGSWGGGSSGGGGASSSW